MEIHLDVVAAGEAVDDTRALLESVLTSRLNALDVMLADRVRENLSGEVLKVQSGALLGTVKEVPATQSGDIIESGVIAGGDDAPYGIYFEMGGTGWYDITPKTAEFLSFIGSSGARVFTKMVNHPPIPHLPWFGPAVDEVGPTYQDELQTVFNEVLA